MTLNYCCYGAYADVGCSDDCPTKRPEPAAPAADQPAAQGSELERFLAAAKLAGFQTIHDVPGLMDALRATEQPALTIAQRRDAYMDAGWPIGEAVQMAWADGQKAEQPAAPQHRPDCWVAHYGKRVGMTAEQARQEAQGRYTLTTSIAAFVEGAEWAKCAAPVAPQAAQAHMTEQQATLLNQAHDMLLAHADEQRKRGNR